MEKIKIVLKDWEGLRKDALARLKDATINSIQYSRLIELCDEEISKLPKEPKMADEADDAMKDIEKEIKNGK